MGRQLAVVVAVGLALSGALLYVVRPFVETGPIAKAVAIVLLLPFAVLSIWGDELGDFMFWGLAVFGQAVYVLGIYFVVRRVFGRGAQSNL